MKGLIALLLFSACILFSCKSVKIEPTEPSHYYNVGDIHFNPATDNRDFILCDSTQIRSGRNRIRYENGQKAIHQACLAKFKFEESFESFTGYITVQFLVNCQLETDRYRAVSMGLDFSPKDSPVELEEHLMSLVKSLDKWTLDSKDYSGIDFSKFINFKITNGSIENILL